MWTGFGGVRRLGAHSIPPPDASVHNLVTATIKKLPPTPLPRMPLPLPEGAFLRSSRSRMAAAGKTQCRSINAERTFLGTPFRHSNPLLVVVHSKNNGDGRRESPSSAAPAVLHACTCTCFRPGWIWTKVSVERSGRDLGRGRWVN